MPRTSQPSGLTAKQERFILEYLKDGSGTRSALAAGYGAKSAAKTASDLLQHPVVKKALAAARRKLAKKLELTAEKVLGDIERIANKAERAKKYGEAISGKVWLGKHFKLFGEKVEITGANGGPVEFTRIERVVVDPAAPKP